VADFLGVSNLMEARANGQGADGACRVRVGDFELKAERGEVTATGPVKVVIRPERVVLEPYETTGENCLPGMVERLVYMGSTMHLIVHLAAGVPLQVMIQNRGNANPFPQGTPVSVLLPADALRVLRGSDEPTPGSEDRHPSDTPAGTPS
jgi:spermidine/putrescine transport system ATP-binding protein